MGFAPQADGVRPCDHEGRRIIVDPQQRAEFVPEGNWRTLDFGDPDQGGVAVVEHFLAAMKKVSLTSAFGERKITGSSSIDDAFAQGLLRTDFAIEGD